MYLCIMGACTALKGLFLFTADPSVLDFGQVVTGAVVERSITLNNFLTKHINITLKVATSTLVCSNRPLVHLY